LISHISLEKAKAKDKNIPESINPSITLKEISPIAPLEKTGLTKMLRKNPLAISLQKLEMTFN